MPSIVSRSGLKPLAPTPSITASNMQENSTASVGVSSELPATSEFPAATAAAAAPGSPGASGRFSRIRHEDSAVLKLKGLPYTTVEQQLLDFFKGYNVLKIAFVYEPDGRPSGLVSLRQRCFAPAVARQPSRAPSIASSAALHPELIAIAAPRRPLRSSTAGRRRSG